MKRIPDATLAEMASQLSEHDRDEMAIPSYLHRNPAMRWMAWRRVEVVAERIRQIARRGKAGTVVDFGCGTGVLFEEESRSAERVVGIDLVLEPAQKLIHSWGLDVDLMTPSEAESALAPGSVDVVVAAEVLEHVEPIEPTLELFAKWMSPDARLLVSLPTENQLYRFGRRLAGFEGHYHHSNAASIDRKIRELGFRRQFRATIPLPGPFAIYWILEYTRPE
jgi:2-polyprenyl-3-methyl-5-hydroxy-6-metoxy-1,4-benzoquinol methylase